MLISGGISVNNTTDATSETSGGCITVAGGIGISKRLIVGGATTLKNATTISDTTQATNLTSGALVVGGGVAVGGDIRVNGSIMSLGTSSYSKIVLTSNESSQNLTTGSLVTPGGISIQTTVDATSVSNGGGLSIAGGMSVIKKVYLNDNVYMYNSTNYQNVENAINLFDNLNIKRFSVDKTSQNNFAISRYVSDTFVDRPFEIHNLSGVVYFNNTVDSISKDTGAVVVNGGVSINVTTEATSSENGGALTVGGGVAIAKNLQVGGDIKLLASTPSNDVSTGTLVVNGGVGVGGDLNVLGNTLIVGNLTVNGQTTTIDTTQTVIKDNIFQLNAGPSGSSDSGFVITRYQTENDIGTGDTVSSETFTVMTLPNQSEITGTQIKLNIEASSQNDYYKNWWIKVIDGFSSNQTRKIVSYNGSTKIATIQSSWTSQNPSADDTVHLYNKPYVGLIFNEMTDCFEFGGTTVDPSDNATFSLSDLVPICFSKATSTSTVGSTSATSGAISVAGGIGIWNSSDATSVTNGGTITTLGGASIGKKLYVGDSLVINDVSIRPNVDDIQSTLTILANNNQTTPGDLTGVTFGADTWGFDVYISVRVVATTNLYTNFHIRGVNKGDSYEIVKTYVGDNTGIEFNITSQGQLQYTTPFYNGFVSCTFKTKAITI